MNLVPLLIIAAALLAVAAGLYWGLAAPKKCAPKRGTKAGDAGRPLSDAPKTPPPERAAPTASAGAACGREGHDWAGCVCKRCGKTRHDWDNEPACGSSACPRGGVEDWVLCGGPQCPGSLAVCKVCGARGE